MMNIMSIDVESDGLWGNPFAVAAILYNEEGREIDKICLRMDNSTVTNEWVKENVLPTLNFPTTHQSNNFFNQFRKGEASKRAYESMLKDFSKWYLENKEDSKVLYHMGHIVEANLFKEMKRLDLIGDFDAPYVPIEVSAYLEMAGEPADSVDGYVEKYKVEVSEYGSTHNPLYDCEVAYKVYRHITEQAYN